MRTRRQKAAPPQPDAPRRGIDQVRWTRVGMVFSLVAAAGFAWSAMLNGPKIVVRERVQPTPPAEARLRAAVVQLARTWHPGDRARLLERLRASEDRAALEQAIGALLRKTTDGRERKALLECARVLEAREIPYTIAVGGGGGGGGGGGLRAAAIGVAHALRAIDPDQIAELLQSEDRGARLGMLAAIARDGGTIPDDLLMRSLLSDDREEGELAVRAFPQRPSAALRERVLVFVTHGEPRAAAQALRALARDLEYDHAELAVSCLQNRAEEVRRAALEFLVHNEKVLDHATAVWKVASDDLAPEALRVFALHCLEAHGAADPEALVARVPGMGPQERLLAARCLVRQGDERCVGILVSLVARDEDPEVVASARRLLAWLTGSGPGSTPEQFEAVFIASGKRVRTRYLPAHGLDL
ncbi:MAG TPA: hypothetical protein VK081_03435 [Planctomycetota bacterium]|nr:hypothetical protein [Planctomycetota bacterium]